MRGPTPATTPGRRDARRAGDSSSPRIASPRPRDTLATCSASEKCAVASTMADAIRAGSDDLKIPEPTNTASAPSCITNAASAGVAMPPAQNSGTGSLPVSWISWTRPTGAPSSLAQP